MRLQASSDESEDWVASQAERRSVLLPSLSRVWETACLGYASCKAFLLPPIVGEGLYCAQWRFGPDPASSGDRVVKAVVTMPSELPTMATRRRRFHSPKALSQWRRYPQSQNLDRVK